MSFIIRWIATAVAVGAAVWIVPGISSTGPNATMAVVALALVLSLINVTLKPILQFLSMPISILTLGIFYLIVNALLLMLAAWATSGIFSGGIFSSDIFSSGIVIDGFGSAFLGSIVISIVSAIVNGLLGNDKSRS